MPLIPDPKLDFLSNSYDPAYEEAAREKPKGGLWQDFRRLFQVVGTQDPKPEWFTIRVRDFAMFPAGACDQDSPYSGERFRREVLVPALQESKDPVVVNLDGPFGYGSNWLKAAFEGLPCKRLRFLTSNPSLETEIRGYMV